MATPKWFFIAFMLSLSLAQTLAHRVKPPSPSDDPSSEPEARKTWSWKSNLAPSPDANGVGYGSGSSSSSGSGSDSSNGYRGRYGNFGEPDPDDRNRRGKKWGRPGRGSGSSNGIPGYGGAPSGMGGGWGGNPGAGIPPYVPNLPPGFRPPVVGYSPIPQIGYPPENGIFYCAPPSCWTGNPLLTCHQQGFLMNINEPMFDIPTDRMGMKDKSSDQTDMEAMAPGSG